MRTLGRRAILSWASLGVLAALCCVLAVLQYRWIGEISRGERERLRAGLQTALNHVSRDFSTELAGASAALFPTTAEIEELGKHAAYCLRYSR